MMQKNLIFYFIGPILYIYACKLVKYSNKQVLKKKDKKCGWLVIVNDWFYFILNIIVESETTQRI